MPARAFVFEGVCPYVYPWNGSNFVCDNDIYSVARGSAGKYRDYYLLQQPLVSTDARYALEVRENDSEESWTDVVGLQAIDHEANTAVAPDSRGNVFAYRTASLLSPVSAQSSCGSNVLSLVNTEDSNGYAAASQDYVDLDFGDAVRCRRLYLSGRTFSGIGSKIPGRNQSFPPHAPQ